VIERLTEELAIGDTVPTGVPTVFPPEMVLDAVVKFRAEKELAVVEGGVPVPTVAVEKDVMLAITDEPVPGRVKVLVT